MNCAQCNKPIANPKAAQRYCSPKCRYAAWEATHRIKRKAPKRIRSRERDRLYTIIHKGDTIEQLRIQAREAARVQALITEETIR